MFTLHPSGPGDDELQGSWLRIVLISLPARQVRPGEKTRFLVAESGGSDQQVTV